MFRKCQSTRVGFTEAPSFWTFWSVQKASRIELVSSRPLVHENLMVAVLGMPVAGIGPVKSAVLFAGKLPGVAFALLKFGDFGFLSVVELSTSKWKSNAGLPVVLVTECSSVMASATVDCTRRKTDLPPKTRPFQG